MLEMYRKIGTHDNRIRLDRPHSLGGSRTATSGGCTCRSRRTGTDRQCNAHGSRRHLLK